VSVAEPASGWVRGASAGELVLVAELAARAGYRAWDLPSLEGFVASSHHRLLVAVDPATRGVRGFVLGSCVADEAEVLLLVVALEARRAGLGRRLLSALEDWARDGGATASFLEVAVGNVAARALYGAAGYEQVGVRRGYYDGEDALCLRRALAGAASR
jgi:ribosomal-protein-alanine N-acetyltransferase